MERRDFPYQRKAKANAASGPAARLVDAEEGLEDALLQLGGNPGALADRVTVVLGRP